ncbi:uncharacterized protein FIBRA_00827 [Fibroporia radiculosa]|uniref:RRM domain-containing protein n=1 Tax=Fibroporia radiculosa TaxID=599839 RepID=J4HS94_9APHY|nr:uncharacterized protein FIBRA_00827 [Fibroporia radiculosa]CCL98822.1 predicted protein [Fibroporia radiculosa]
MLANSFRVQIHARSHHLAASVLRCDVSGTIRRSKLPAFLYTARYSTSRSPEVLAKARTSATYDDGIQTRGTQEIGAMSQEQVPISEPGRTTSTAWDHGASDTPTDTLFLGNLSPWATVGELRKIFSRFGEPVIILKVTSAGQSRGFAHLQFPNVQYAKKVLDFHKRYPFMTGGRQLRIVFSTSTSRAREPSSNIARASRSLYVGNVPYNTKEEELQKLFATYGAVVRVNLTRDEENNRCLYAHVDFELLEDTRAILDAQWTKRFELQGRPLWIDYSRTSYRQRRVEQISATEDDDRDVANFRRSYAPSRSLWVGGMPPDVIEEDVKRLFKYWNGCEVNSRDERCRSFAHVDFMSVRLAIEIMESHRKTPLKLLDKRPVLLDFAPPMLRSDYPPNYTLYCPALIGDEIDVRTLFGRHAKNIREIRFRELFFLKSWGRVIDSSAVRSPDHRPLIDPAKKAGFIEFFTTAQARAARDSLNGKVISPGWHLSLEFARQSTLQRKRAAGVVSEFGMQPTEEEKEQLSALYDVMSEKEADGRL